MNNSKINTVLNRAFCEQYKREVGIDLQFNQNTIIYNKKRVVLTNKLKEELREMMYDHISDTLYKRQIIFN